VVSKLAGNKTARAVIEALIDGERDPRRLADLALTRLRGRRADLEQALEGMTFGRHHARLARMHLDRIDALDRHVAALDDEIAACLDAIPAAWGVPGEGVGGRAPGRGAAALSAAARLAEIPGVTLGLAMAIIAETGLDMTRFQTAGHLVSWAGLAPAARQSGARSRKPARGQGDSYLRGYCTQAANGAGKTDTFLGERLRRLSRRLGGARARCAVGRSILVIIWHLLSDPAARYTDLGAGWHDRKTDLDKKIQGHISQLRALGLDVTVTQAAA
jgi:transposase